MVNFFNQFFIKRIYKGPSTHFVKPKVLNIRYAGNLLPNYIFLNLEDVFRATPELKENDDKTFSLNLNVVKNDNTEIVISLGLFKQEKLAKEAYVKTINAFFSPAYSLIKTFLTLAIIGAALQVSTSYIMGVTQAISQRNAQITQNAQNEVEKQKIEELQKRKAAFLKQQAEQIPPFARTAPNMQQNPVPNMQGIPQVPTPELMAERLKNQEGMNQIHNDLDNEIERIRSGKTANKVASPADILLKELKGQ